MRTVVMTVCCVIWAAGTGSAESLRIAMSEAATGETAPFLLALQRLEEAGFDVDVDVMASDDDVIEAVSTGTVDLGLGTPFQRIVQNNLDVRAVAQVSRLAFSLVISSELEGPEDYNGVSVMVHAPGSGTEATSWAYERELGVRFGPTRYVGGSDNRAVALIAGAGQAAVVDFENRNLVLEMAGDRFVVLPELTRPASDDVLYATQAVRDARADVIAQLRAELDEVWRGIRGNPVKAAAALTQDTLAGRLSDREFNSLPRFFEEALVSGLLPDPETPDVEIAQADADVHSPGSAAADFWDLSFSAR